MILAVDALQIIVPIVVWATFVTWLVRRLQRPRRRRAALKSIAHSLGLQFDPARRRDLAGFTQFDAFDLGTISYTSNTITGRAKFQSKPVAVNMGDMRSASFASGGSYRYSTHRPVTLDISYLLLAIELHTAVTLTVQSRSLLDKLVTTSRSDHVDALSAEFHRAFEVRTKDKRVADEVMNRRMMEFFLETRPPFVQCGSSFLFVSSTSARWKPDEFLVHLDWVKRFLELWSKHLGNERAGGASV